MAVPWGAIIQAVGKQLSHSAKSAQYDSQNADQQALDENYQMPASDTVVDENKQETPEATAVQTSNEKSANTESKEAQRPSEDNKEKKQIPGSSQVKE